MYFTFWCRMNAYYTVTIEASCRGLRFSCAPGIHGHQSTTGGALVQSCSGAGTRSRRCPTRSVTTIAYVANHQLKLPPNKFHTHLHLSYPQWGEDQEPSLPDKIQHFHSLYPLEAAPGPQDPPSAALGVRSFLLKAINGHDGAAYALRRIDGRQVGCCATICAASFGLRCLMRICSLCCCAKSGWRRPPGGPLCKRCAQLDVAALYRCRAQAAWWRRFSACGRALHITSTGRRCLGATLHTTSFRSNVNRCFRGNSPHTRFGGPSRNTHVSLLTRPPHCNSESAATFLPPQVIPTAELLTSARKAVAAWAPLANHPALAGLRGTFVSDEIDGTNSLFFVHDYHPGALWFIGAAPAVAFVTRVFLCCSSCTTTTPLRLSVEEVRKLLTARSFITSVCLHDYHPGAFWFASYNSVASILHRHNYHLAAFWFIGAAPAVCR